MNAWNSVAARDAAAANASGSAIEPDDEPSAAMSGTWPSGAVGSGFGAAFSRFGSSARGSARFGAGAVGRATRVTGRATARFDGAVAFAVVFFAVAALAGALFAAVFGAVFGAASVRFAPAVAAVGFFTAFWGAPAFAAPCPALLGSSRFCITPSSPSRSSCAGRARRPTG
jgi:hypothetical protein